MKDKKMKIQAIKDGNGNIIISEGMFELLLSCLDNQKFINESPQNGDSLSVGEDKYWIGQQDIQNTIDHYNREFRKILNQKYILRTECDGFYLVKRYEHQQHDTEWTGTDIDKVYELFKDTQIIYETPNKFLPLDGSEEIIEGTNPIGKSEDGWLLICAPDSEKRPWLIERPLRYDGMYLTISENGTQNRPWKQEEIEKIQHALNN